MSDSPWHCDCKYDESISVGWESKWRAFSPSGEKGAEIHVRAHTTQKLPLPAEKGNIVKIEYYDAGWTPVGCYGPVNHEDNVTDHKESVTINGTVVEAIDCPDD